MKTNINLKIKTAKRTKLGRMLCRLTGNQCGAVMMEYVILAVLVAAAAVVAVMYFGHTVRHQVNSAASAAAGQSADSVAATKQAQQDAKDSKDKGQAHSKNYGDQGGDK